MHPVEALHRGVSVTNTAPGCRGAHANREAHDGLHRLALPAAVRAALLLFVATAAAGCGLLPTPADEAAGGPVDPPRAVASHPDSLLARLRPGALDYVFAPGRGTAADGPAWSSWRAAGVRLGYQVDALSGGRTVGRYRALAGGGVEEAVGTLADTAGVRAAPPESPLPLVLPAEPPFADPRVRDRYARRALATTWPRAAAAEAVLVSDDGAQAVRRAVVVVDTTTGRVLAAEVWRRTRSLLYDEDTHARVTVGRAPDGRAVLRAQRVETRVDTPGSPPRHYVQSWTANVAR